MEIYQGLLYNFIIRTTVKKETNHDTDLDVADFVFVD